MIQIEALKSAGVDEVVLAIGYQPHLMSSKMADWEEKLGVKITYSHETEPMGTAGPLGLARDILMSDAEPFFVLNSDVTCRFPLTELLAFHRSHGGEGTIMATRVEEPSKYGVVVSDPTTGQIQRFVEKPQVFVGNFINAGIYVFNKSILNRIPNPVVPTSIEKVVFPAMAADKQLYVMELVGHWADVGQPPDYLSGTVLHLKYFRECHPERLAQGEGIVGNVLIDPTAKIGKDCLIGPDVVIGPGCVVGDGARYRNRNRIRISGVSNFFFCDDRIFDISCSLIIHALTFG
jgi:mannose-1-phosphate guanylyltransferase